MTDIKNKVIEPFEQTAREHIENLARVFSNLYKLSEMKFKGIGFAETVRQNDIKNYLEMLEAAAKKQNWAEMAQAGNEIYKSIIEFQHAVVRNTNAQMTPTESEFMYECINDITGFCGFMDHIVEKLVEDTRGRLPR